MKKQFFVYLFAALTLGSVVTSCSDDDNETIVVCPIETTTFNSDNGLNLTYSGAPLLGKQVVFTPNTADATKATLVLSGNKFAVAGMPFEIPGSGVVPGEETTTLNVDLIINGDAISFEGVDEKEGRTISYKGSANRGGMKLDLNVKMPKNALTGKTIYCLKTEKKSSDFDPLILDWSYNKDLGFDYDEDGKNDITEDHAFNLFAPMLNLPLIDKKLTIADFLYGVFRDVTFLEDGNIQASYKDQPADADFKTSPLNIATYQFIKEGQIKLFLNPDMIHHITKAVEKASSRAEDNALTDFIQPVLSLVNECMVKGITLNYGLNEKGFLEFYLDDATITRPLFNTLVPVVQDPTVLAIMEKLVKENIPEGLVIMGFIPVTPDFAWDMISKFLKSTPETLKNTNYIKLGMVFSENK